MILLLSTGRETSFGLMHGCICISRTILDMSRGNKGNSKSVVDSASVNEIFDNEAVNDVRLVNACYFQYCRLWLLTYNY